MDLATEFQAKILSRRPRSEDYDVYKAALEWDLTDPIVIDNANDFKSTPRWQERLTPYHHQVTNLITFCRRLPVTLLADDVGLGKTISAGMIVSELVARARVSKVLVVCPKLLGPQWKQELESKFDIHADIATGRSLLKADPDEPGAVITTYNSARLYLESIPEDRFQMLILDEAHKLRNLHGTQKPPQVALRFRDALEKRRFQFVLMLTATPIHNRLWDLYSLVELLTVARGHQNPFGNPGSFARRFIADSSDQARRLNPDAQDEFRSIVYGYMSRVRRSDAKLYFPDRIVQMHKVQPTEAELDLIKIVAKSIRSMNRLAQISILQALTSSPHALAAQLSNMARNGTYPPKLAAGIKEYVSKMPMSAKLRGLDNLIRQLKQENPTAWRLVIFTGRRETQTTIQTFLEERGLTVGLISGANATQNQETINRFREEPPRVRVVVSTEAGAEGVNLQAANVLVNYDLPWNPMIVEQRIGRVQRLASQHAHVTIFNTMLVGTFEEYIVGRLIEKLQLASHAVGDIESLLEGTDAEESEDDAGASFEERIRRLVLAALDGKDIEKETRLAEASIENAQVELEREREMIDATLGGMNGAGYVGPRAPSLPETARSMELREFALAALKSLDVEVSHRDHGLYALDDSEGRELITFSPTPNRDVRATYYGQGTPAFSRLVDRVCASGIHDIEDADANPSEDAERIVRAWVEDFGGKVKAVEVSERTRTFEGHALMRIRATVAHDSYERLIEIPCSADEHRSDLDEAAVIPLAATINDPTTVGINITRLMEAAAADAAISEFGRFYLERREIEVAAAAGDDRKVDKVREDFTPRINMTLAGLRGRVAREIEAKVHYTFDSGPRYVSELTVRPSAGDVLEAPNFEACYLTGKRVPNDTLAACDITSRRMLKHLAAKSGVSNRLACPEFAARCSLTGKTALSDEIETSAVTGQSVAKKYLATSQASGQRAEPEHFAECTFTGVRVLKTELAQSEFSGKHYRTDQGARSSVSAKTGHESEFVTCQMTNALVGPSEYETCEATGATVRLGTLQRCEVTGGRVLPSELETCAVTGSLAQKRLLTTSSVSNTRILESVATRSLGGNMCAPSETKECVWSGRRAHPEDVAVCELTRLRIHVEFLTQDDAPRLRALVELLDGVRRNTDEADLWETVAVRLSEATKGARCRIEAAILSPTGAHLAVCSEVRTLLGIRVQHAGTLFELNTKTLLGRIAVGKRASTGWA